MVSGLVLGGVAETVLVITISVPALILIGKLLVMSSLKFAVSTFALLNEFSVSSKTYGPSNWPEKGGTMAILVGIIDEETSFRITVTSSNCGSTISSMSSTLNWVLTSG